MRQRSLLAQASSFPSNVGGKVPDNRKILNAIIVPKKEARRISLSNLIRQSLLSLSRAHTHTQARKNARTHTHIHTSAQERS